MAIMMVMPVRVVRLLSDLPTAALADLLRAVVGAGVATPFTGEVTAEGFVVTRMNEYRSTFMPVVRGRFLPQPDPGTGVLLHLRPPATVLVFMGIWLAFLGAVAAIIVAAHASAAGRSLLLLLAPAGLGAFSWFLMTAVFSTDARWAIEHLVEAVPALRREGDS